MVAERWKCYEGQQCGIVSWSLVSSADEVKVREGSWVWDGNVTETSSTVDFLTLWFTYPHLNS